MKIKKILVLAALPLVLVSCTNKTKNTEVLEALNVEYNVPSGKVEEMTGYEFEPSSMKQVAVMKDQTKGYIMSAYQFELNYFRKVEVVS